MNIVAVFLVSAIGIPIVSILWGWVLTRNWTAPTEATTETASTDIYARHEAYNRYEDRLYKEM